MNDLNSIIPNDLLTIFKKSDTIPGNLMGLLRVIMILNDWKKYFENSYNKIWAIHALEKYEFMTHYKIPLDQIKIKYQRK